MNLNYILTGLTLVVLYMADVTTTLSADDLVEESFLFQSTVEYWDENATDPTSQAPENTTPGEIVSTEEDGSGDGDNTTTTTTTVPTTTTTTATITTTRPDVSIPDIGAQLFNMELSFKFNLNISEGRQLQNEVLQTLNEVFAQLYQEDFDFRGITLKLPFRSGSTIVDYTADYGLATAMVKASNISDATVNKVFPDLATSSINGTDGLVDEDYLNETATQLVNNATTQLEVYESDLCEYASDTGSDICPLGYTCSQSQCYYKCIQYLENCDDNNGICYTDDLGEPKCGCDADSLYISESHCFREDYLIVICAVVGGILLLTVIALGVFVCTRNNNALSDEYNTRRISQSDILQHERQEAYRMEEEDISRGEDVSRGSGFQMTFSQNNGTIHSHTSSEGRNSARDSVIRTNAYDNRAYIYDRGDMDSFGRRQKGASQSTPREDPYYNNLLESEEYKMFSPKLDHIDTGKDYKIKRPTVSNIGSAGSSVRDY